MVTVKCDCTDFRIINPTLMTTLLCYNCTNYLTLGTAQSVTRHREQGPLLTAKSLCNLGQNSYTPALHR